MCDSLLLALYPLDPLSVRFVSYTLVLSEPLVLNGLIVHVAPLRYLFWVFWEKRGVLGHWK